jgi:hypothetical protein
VTLIGQSNDLFIFLFDAGSFQKRSIEQATNINWWQGTLWSAGVMINYWPIGTLMNV